MMLQAQSISSTGTLSAVNACAETASNATSFSVSGTSMLVGITVTPPTGYEVSLSSDSGYNSLIIVGSSGTINSTTVYVRLAETDSVGTYSGNIVLSSSGATSINMATVASRVNVLPTVTAGANTSICIGESTIINATTLGGSAPYMYSWSPAINLSSSTILHSIFSSTNAGLTTLTLSVTDNNGCSNSATVAVTVNAKPTVSISAPTSIICSNAASTVITASPVGGTYTGVGMTDSVFNPSNAYVGQNRIKYNYTDINGCSSSDSIAITVTNTPIPTVTNASCVVGSTIPSLTAVGTGTIAWFSDSAATTLLGTGSTYTSAISNTTVITNMYYVINNANGCSSSIVPVTLSIIADTTVILPTAITLAPSSISVTLGSTAQVTASILPTNASNPSVAWISSNSTIATVSSTGVVTGVAAGIATITATSVAKASIKAMGTVTVSDSSVKVASVSVSPTTASIIVGNNITLTDSISPSNATNKSVIWKTSDSTIATVNSVGVITGKKAGTCTITVTTADGNYTATSTIIILHSTDATLKTLFVSAGTLNPEFTPTITSYSVELPYGSIVVPTVATAVNDTKATNKITQATALPGNACAVVTAEDGTVKTYTVTFTIAKVLISKITIAPSASQSMNIGAKTSLTAMVIPLNSDNSAINWRSSNPAIASVDSTGKVTGITTGNAFIIATSRAVAAVKDSIAITILPQDVVTVLQQFTSVTVTLSQSTSPYNIADYFNGNGITFKVISSNPAIVSTGITATGFGLVQNSAGTDTITVIATSDRGTTKTLTFLVVVKASSTATTNCGTISVSGAITDVSCAGTSTGSVVVSVSGGAAPYKYKWSNTRSDNKITNIPAGDYTIVVTDSNSCATAKTFSIKENVKIILASTVKTPTCGESDGVIGIVASGGTSPFSYKWGDGTTATTVSNKAAGNYTVSVTDALGCIQSQSFSLNNTNAPIIMLDSIVPSTCHPNNGKIAISVIGGTGTYSYNWNDGANIESRENISSGSYSLTVTDAALCHATIDAIVPSVGFKQPKISLVTVDISTGNNLIIWMKEKTTYIEYYSIYRETNNSGVYSFIGKVPFGSSSIYTDNNVSSATTSWRYRLSATDYCGNESSMSAALAEFKTINLKITSSAKSIDLNWDSYEGFNYCSYIIYRNGVAIDTVPASVNSFIDSLAPNGNNYYTVAVQLPNTLYPNGLLTKSDSAGPFSQALSNMAESELTSAPIQKVTSEVLVYPNPSYGDFMVKISGENAKKYSIELINPLGKKVFETNTGMITKTMVNLDASTLSSGIYTLKVTSIDGVKTKQVVITK